MIGVELVHGERLGRGKGMEGRELVSSGGRIILALGFRWHRAHPVRSDGRHWRLRCQGSSSPLYMYTHCIITPARSTPVMQYAKGIMQCKTKGKFITHSPSSDTNLPRKSLPRLAHQALLLLLRSEEPGAQSLPLHFPLLRLLIPEC